LAKNVIFVNAKYKKLYTNVARISSAVPGSKTPISPTEICQ